MVKERLLPLVLGSVAGITLFPELAFMSLFVVDLAMTFEALGGDLFQLLLSWQGLQSGLVAIGTLGIAMLAFKRVVGVLVVIEVRLLPASLVMTRFTLVAQTALVALFVVVLLVAGETLRLQLFVVEGAGVTGGALGLSVLAAQFVLGFAIMIENRILP